MKKKKIVFILIISIFSFLICITNTNARSVTYYFNLTGIQMAWETPAYKDYKYAVMQFKATEGAKTVISFYGTKDISFTQKLGNSANFSLKSENKVYILPRSGMACPGDATYCFGAGKYYNSTTIMSSEYEAYAIGFDGGDSNYTGSITYYT